MAESDNLLGVAGSQVHVRRMGRGPELLFLHGHLGFWKLDPFFEELAKSFSLIIPAHPGFEGSPVDPRLNSVDDLSYLYLDLLDALELEAVAVAGSSFGAWIGLSIAVKDASRFSSLALIDPVGAHFGGPEEPGVADIFSMGEAEFSALGFADPAQGRKPYGDMSDQELLVSSRNREAAARYAWMPPLYDPKLAQRLHRVKTPTRILWGEKDRITGRPYADQMVAHIPGASLEVIEGAGHFPVIEQPGLTASWIAAFAR